MDQIINQIPQMPGEAERPVVHGPEEFGVRPAPPLEAPRRSGFRVIGILIAIAVILAVGGGTAYAWWRYEPRNVVKGVVEEFLTREVYGYTFEASIAAPALAGGAPALQVMAQGTADAKNKKGVMVVHAALRADGEQHSFEAELRSFAQQKKLYIKVAGVPPEIQQILSLPTDPWVVIDMQSERLQQIMQVLSERGGGRSSAGDAWGDIFSDEQVMQLQTRLAAVLTDPASYEIVPEMPWWQSAWQRDGTLRYTITMREEAAARYFDELTSATPLMEATVKLDNTIRQDFIDTFSATHVTITVDHATNMLQKIEGRMAPPRAEQGEALVFAATFTPVSVAPTITEPSGASDFFELIARILFVGATPGYSSAAGADQDGDGLSDQDELFIYQSDPSKYDTDGDGYADGDEVRNGYNPNGDGPLPSVLAQAKEIEYMKSRDATRISHVKQIQTALELYYSEKSGYPLSLEPRTLGDETTVCLGQNGFSAHDCRGAFMTQLPSNPLPGGAPYRYQALTPRSYELTFALEVGTGGLHSGPYIGDESGIHPGAPSAAPSFPDIFPPSGQNGYAPVQLGQTVYQQKQKRDEQRMNDLRVIQTGLELYFSDKNEYPRADGIVTLGTGSQYCLTSNGFQALGACSGGVYYLTRIPSGPTEGGIIYRYRRVKPDFYEIYFSLEAGVQGVSEGPVIGTPSGVIEGAGYQSPLAQ